MNNRKYVHVRNDMSMTVEEIKNNLPSEEELYDLAEVFKVFGDSTRIKILYTLYESELCVADIAAVLHHF